jgi:hypothetical protein
MIGHNLHKLLTFWGVSVASMGNSLSAALKKLELLM